jgi:hypothetical protein
MMARAGQGEGGGGSHGILQSGQTESRPQRKAVSTHCRQNECWHGSVAACARRCAGSADGPRGGGARGERGEGAEHDAGEGHACSNMQRQMGQASSCPSASQRPCHCAMSTSACLCASLASACASSAAAPSSSLCQTPG